MIHVSNSIIVGRGQNNTGFTETRPKFWAPMFRAIHGTALDPEKGIEIIDIADFAPDQGKYAAYESVNTAERDIITFFIGNDSSRRARVVAAFNSCFPDGLKPVIEKHVAEDMARSLKRVEALKNVVKDPHPSFIEAGIDATAALNLMLKGYGTVSDCATVPAMDLVDAGLTPDKAAMLVDAAQRARSIAIEADKAATIQAVTAPTETKFAKK